MSIPVPDRRVKAPKPERRRRDVSGVITYGAPVAEGHEDGAASNGARRRELHWIRYQDEWVVEMVMVTAGEDGSQPL